TILLDEIGDISPRLQIGLLRVLETGEIRAVGSARSRKINCRIIAATNADLDDQARSDRFRTDLLFRLHRLGLHIPPLRDRPEDILLLARHFLDIGRPVGTHAAMSEELTDAIRRYDWPGNVRELRNVIERMRLMHSDRLSYEIGDLGLKFHHQEARAPSVPAPVSPSLPQPEGVGFAPRVDPGSFHPTPVPEDEVTRMLQGGRSQLRRVERLKQLFTQHRTLTRSEVTRILDVSPNTATKYLKVLCEEEFIHRIEPSASTRSHYFELAE
ncbi:MAG: sigma-54-dependent Fis family transcriptional regulator, partial [Lentisphaerae bacterium]|nr:sigma-54-dependent Fis family transcriptional regulator [Lentisphaerota bacterium]